MNAIFEIKRLITDEDIFYAYDTISSLRPHLIKENFIKQIRMQEETGYILFGGFNYGDLIASAGIRIYECLAYGKNVYIDDLVINDEKRSQGYGKKMLDWIEAYGKANGCRELHLDSGVQRFSAHRFYFREKFHIPYYHFSKNI